LPEAGDLRSTSTEWTITEWHRISYWGRRSGEWTTLKMFDTVIVFRPVPVSRKRARWDRKSNDIVLRNSTSATVWPLSLSRNMDDGYTRSTEDVCTMQCRVWTWWSGMKLDCLWGNSQPVILQSAVTQPHTLFTWMHRRYSHKNGHLMPFTGSFQNNFNEEDMKALKK
jgi:hypothetical protein